MSTKQRGDRGAGRIYQRGQIWWIQYCFRGKVFRETSRSEDERIARRLLRKRLGEIGVGSFLGPKVEKTTFEELTQDIVNDYKVNGRKSSDKIVLRLSSLKKTFGFDRMIDITTDRINSYVVKRQKDGMANATINRELQVLRRMFNLGLQSNKLATKPYISMLKENNIRTGFFERDDFVRLRQGMRENLRPLIAFAYFTGWRSEEIRSLQWRQVDLRVGCVRLDAGTTKNGEGRIVYLPSEIQVLLNNLWRKRRLDCPWVFHRNGKMIVDFREAWHKACREAGLAGMIFHDFRRTAVRNMIRAGIPERVAMQISGHKTRSIFDRYHIVSESDLKEAALRQDKFSRHQDQYTGEILPFETERKDREIN